MNEKLGVAGASSLARVDVVSVGAGTADGPIVVLVHSSVSGARQWRRLMEALEHEYEVRAVNLFGYGKTPPWPGERPLELADLAGLVLAAVPEASRPVALVGHSLGASVAMKAALALGSRARKLLLIEPNTFHLLRDSGRSAAFAEILDLRDTIKAEGAAGTWETAAERFADYWGGAGTWAGMPPERRAAFTDALRPNWHEWDAVLGETLPLARWVEGLPARTHVIWDPATVRPIGEIVEVMRQGTPWTFETLPRGGHMAPLTYPDLVNPMVARFLAG